MESPPPILVVSDVAARLVRRGLLDPADPTVVRWEHARVFVFLYGPVQYELPMKEAASVTVPR